MCGFAGVIAWEDEYRTSREVLARMSAAVAHRGPDGEGMWFNHEEEVTAERPQAALAFRRLAIIDLDPRANQPMTDGQGRWIVFNGEIYNYRELRRELSSLDPQYAWRTKGDTEVLLRSYAQWGEKCVEHLNGMFAFAVWDEGKKELYLARDRMGQKPLYVAAGEANGTLIEHERAGPPTRAIAFASELSALRHLHWMDVGMSDTALRAYLSLGYIPNGTIYQGAIKLAPGCSARISASGVRTRQYFQPYNSFHEKTIADGDAVGKTRSLLYTAVRRQLVADVPLGCFLSGGIDSSVIATAMRRAVPRERPLLTFSIGFDDKRYNETPYAATVAKHVGAEHREFLVRPDAVADLPRLAEVFGEPFGDSSALPTHYLARETRRHAKVALSGDGGDELFGGYDRYRALAWTERLASIPAGIRRAVAAPARLIPGAHPKGRSARVKRLLSSLHLSADRRYAGYMRIFPPELTAELLEYHGEQREFDNLAGLFAVGMTARPLVPNALAVDRVTYLPDDLLTKVDRASMLHALEVRSPFMDHELVEFAAGLTTDQLIKGGPKRMLREAFAKDLPEFVFKRKKMGFAVPIGEWMRGELRPMLHDHLFAGDSFASAHFNRKVVERLVAEHQEERVDHSQRLYALLMLELWWRIEKGRGAV